VFFVVAVGKFAGVAQCKNLVITAEHSKYMDVDNRVITKL
jgi:hypothetical protein